MNYRVVSIPPFKAVYSAVDKEFDFSDEGRLGKFNAFFSAIAVQPENAFTPRDYLYYDKKQGGLIWMFASFDTLDTKEFPLMDFDGGLYVTYFYIDGDQAENERLYQEAIAWIADSDMFVLDERDNHYAMGHIITPPLITQRFGVAQMECFIPVRVL